MRARAVVCLVALAGCSFTMPDAPDRPYRSMPDCETSRAKPVIDMLGAGTALSVALVFALAAAIEDDLGDGEETGELGTTALVSLGAGAVFTVSAIGGFGKGLSHVFDAECRNNGQRAARRRHGHQATTSS